MIPATPRIAQTSLLVWTFRVGFRDHEGNIGPREPVSRHDEMLCGTPENGRFPVPKHGKTDTKSKLKLYGELLA